MAVLNKDQLYFFDQPKRCFKKRQRKSVDQLPFSLAFTGVSGTLKVEAYLKQQLRISEQETRGSNFDDPPPQQQSELNARENEKTNAVCSSSVPAKSGENDHGTAPGARKTEYSRKARIIPNLDVNFSRDRDEDDEEDTQRFLFEENKFAAPNLLAHLGRLLEWLYGKQLEKNDAPVRNRTNANWANLTSNNLKASIIDVGASVFDLHVLDISVPFHLQEKLKWNFNQLIANAVYTKRQWQTASYRQQAAASQRGVPHEALAQVSSVNISNISKNNLSKQDSFSVSKKSRKPGDEHVSRNLSHSETAPNLGKRESGSGTPMEELQVPTEILPPSSVLGFRRESVKTTPVQAPRTRLEKYKYLPDKATLALHGRRRAGAATTKQEVDQENEKGKEATNTTTNNNNEVSQQGQPPLSSIAFSLMSKACEDQGWVNREGQDEDLERLTVIEWARNRLSEAISSRTLCALKEKERGEDGPLIVKQYGESRSDLTGRRPTKQAEEGFLSLKDVRDSKRDGGSLANKCKDPVIFQQYGENKFGRIKKGKSKIRRTSSGTAKLELFLIVLPDSTMTLYYPSGKVAVCVAKNTFGNGKYTYVYDNDSHETLMAYFTPSNAFCCDKHGRKFLCSSKEGTIYEKEGFFVRKWTWKASKLTPAVLFEINEYLTLRVVNRDTMTLHYNAQQESYKVSVGVTQDGPSVNVNAITEMMTTGEYLSNAVQQQQAVKPKPKNKREERKAKANQRKQSQEQEAECQQEQRKEELDKKFPERKNLALDIPSDVELYKLKRRIKNVAYEWMESYRLLVGISSPVKIPKHARRKQTSSARSLPGALPSSQEALRRMDRAISSLDNRAPSAPPGHRGDKSDVSKALTFDRHLSLGDRSRGNALESSSKKPAANPVYLTEVEKQRLIPSAASPRPPFRCGMEKFERRLCSPKEGCPLALRAEILGEKYAFCRCRKRQIPFVSDVGYDVFIRERVSPTQLLVVSIVSSRHPDATPCTSMLEQLYFEKNKSRSFPCSQARDDPFRIVLYDVDSSVKSSETVPPLLVRRHNVVPGMFLMYVGGKLLFADHIFNGYGNARKDFLKQIIKSRKDYLQGLFLHDDFRLSPTPGRSGLRSAWGGEIGGLSKNVCRTDSLPTKYQDTPVASRLQSAVTSASSDSIVVRANGAKSAASFVNLGLSIEDSNSPFTRLFRSKPSTPLLRKTAPHSKA